MFRRLDLYCIIAAIGGFLADQGSKVAFQGVMDGRSGQDLEVIPGFFSLVSSFNTGVAFGMFSDAPRFVIYLPVLAIIGVMIYLLRTSASSNIGAIGIGLVIGGALGNQVDRVLAGRVFDFLLLYVGELKWPAFNGADIFIVTGVILYGISVFMDENAKKDSPDHSA